MSGFYMRGYRKRKWNELNGEELDRELTKLTTKADTLRRIIEREGLIRFGKVWFATAEGLRVKRLKEKLRRTVRTINAIADAELGR